MKVTPAEAENHAALAAQLRRLRSCEDPTNASPTAVVYETAEMPALLPGGDR